MSDSLLSIYNELDKDGKNKDEIERLKEEVNNLTQMITELNANKINAEEKLKEMDGL